MGVTDDQRNLSALPLVRPPRTIYVKVSTEAAHRWLDNRQANYDKAFV